MARAPETTSPLVVPGAGPLRSSSAPVPSSPSASFSLLFPGAPCPDGGAAALLWILTTGPPDDMDHRIVPVFAFSACTLPSTVLNSTMALRVQSS